MSGEETEPTWIEYAATEITWWLKEHEQVRKKLSDEPSMFLFAAFRIGELIQKNYDEHYLGRTQNGN